MFDKLNKVSDWFLVSCSSCIVVPHFQKINCLRSKIYLDISALWSGCPPLSYCNHLTENQIHKTIIKESHTNDVRNQY